jgi:hypothetical protein
MKKGYGTGGRGRCSGRIGDMSLAPGQLVKAVEELFQEVGYNRDILVTSHVHIH